MRRTIFAGIFALAASTSLAQTPTAPKPVSPEEGAPQSGTSETAAPTNPAATQQTSAGQPANLCQELLAFMQAPPPEEAVPAAPAKEQAPADKSASAQEKSSTAQKETSALAGTTGSGHGASAKPENGKTSAQAVTGQDGVATDAPKPSDEKAAAGSVANAPQKESRAAPMPTADVTSTPRESVMTVAQAQELASANDIAQCQDAARKMRVAGVAMPPPLIALAALDLQYQQNSDAGAAPSQTEAPAASGQNPAPETETQQ